MSTLTIPRWRRRSGSSGTSPVRAFVTVACLCAAITLGAQQPARESPQGAPPGDTLAAAPNRRADEGQGPFKTLAIRGAMLIDGTGAPPQGPVDIVVQGNRITAVRSAGTPGLPMRANRSPQADHEIDATGMYVLPGFVDMHVHAGGSPKNAEAEYAYKLWLAHGVTTVRGVGLTGQAIAVKEKRRSEKNEIVAPRIYNYQRPGSGWSLGAIDSPDKAREYVRWAAANGIDGLKLGAERPEIMTALLDEAKKNGLGSTAHLQQSGVAQMNAIKAARLGLGTVTHFYGHFESLLKDYVVQPWPVDMNASDEQWRFGQVARLWDKIYEPGSPEWKAYLQEHLKLGTVFDPTLTIYSAGRDVMKFRNADWHEKYTLPSLMAFYEPSRSAHGSYWYYWTTHDEVAWRNFYQVWFKLVNDYKKMGGRVTTGSDSGFIYQTYGFGFVNELEMLQEAGFHPLEAIQAATMNGALTLAEPKGALPEFGTVRSGMLADMVIVDQNPLENFKVLYGTGAVKLNDQTGRPERVGGVKYTIKDGIVYDARQLLAEVAAMVEKQKRERPKTTTEQAPTARAGVPAARCARWGGSGGGAPRALRKVSLCAGTLAVAVGLFAEPSSRAAGQLNLDVVAMDDRGVPVKDLRPSEFEVWINGFQIPIKTVTFVSPDSPSEGRIIVLLLDDMAVQQTDLPRVREAARRFVDRMAPGDRIAVVSLNGDAMEATDDKARVRHAIDSHYIRLVQMRLEDAGAHVLNTVTTISRQLAETPGSRNAIVAIGGGWLLDTPIPPPTASRDLRPEWVAAMQASAAAHVTFYVIDPAGVGTRRANSGTSGFARETGGYAFMNTNDLAGSADRILKELGTYYVLSVEDPPIGRKADLRELEIKVLRRGVTARARRGILPGI